MEAERDTDLQFGCYLSPEEAEQLKVYAEGMEISRPKLCILLIVRELRSPRLAGMPRGTAATLPKSRSKRVTARAINPGLRERFAKRAAALGLGSDEATSIIFRAELAERWLERSLSGKGNRT